MKQRILTISIGTLLALHAAAQTSPDSLLVRLPSGIQVKDSGPRTYRFLCDYLHLDTKGGSGGPTIHMAGEYTRGLPEGKVRWNNVTANGQPREFMEGFTYLLSDTKRMLQPEFFQKIPPMAFNERNLVWDTAMFEGFGQSYFEKLNLNVPYHVPPEMFSLAGQGEFENKDIELTWIGISERNGQKCALIAYQAFLNKLSAKANGFELIGRSDYWGQIWVSLTTKQIEYATLYEEVLGEMKLTVAATPQVLNVFRRGTFERIMDK